MKLSKRFESAAKLAVSACLASTLAVGANAYDVDLQTDTIYQIMVDRFYDGDPSNNATGAPFRHQLDTEMDMHYMKGGDWQGVIDKMSYIQQLGFTAIWISPIADPQLWRMPAADGSQFPAAFHGYNAHDPDRANRYFGNIDPQKSKEKLKELVDVAHEHGIKVILDVVPNHVGDFMARDHYFSPNNVQPGTQFQPKAPYNTVNWYHHNGDTDFDYASSLSKQDKMVYLEKTDLGGLDDFDFHNPDAKSAIFNSYKNWFDYLELDGARVDAAKSMFPSDIHELEETLNVATFGENFDGDVDFVKMWVGDQGEWGMLDFPMYFAIKNSFLYGHDFNADGGIKSVLDQDYKYNGSANRMVTFIDNHDRNRMLAETMGNTDKSRNAIAYLYTTRGVPVIFQGTEAEKGNHNGTYITKSIQDTWNRWPMVEKDAQGNIVDDSFQVQTQTKSLLSKLNQARRDYLALSTGTQREMWQAANVYAFSRRIDDGVGAGQEVIAAFSNQYFDIQQVSIPLHPESTIPTGAQLVNVLNPNEFYTVPANRKLTLTLSPNSHKIFAYKADTVSPTVPSSFVNASVSATTATLNWAAATDSNGIAEYQLYRNGVHVQTVQGLTAHNTGLKVETEYRFQVRSIDNQGNASQLSPVITVKTTDSEDLVTKIYYQRGFATPYIHYKQATGLWTVAPGVALDNASGFPGYSVTSDIALGSSGTLEAVFNNGAGQWDNNGGLNYVFQSGVYTIADGVITAGEPGNQDIDPPTEPTGLTTNELTSSKVDISWNASTDNIAVSHYVVYRNGLQLGNSDSTQFSDTGVVGNHYYNYQITAVDTSGNESELSDVLPVRTPESDGIQVTFLIHGAVTVPGEDVYIVGNHALLGNWSPVLASGPGDGSAYPVWTLTKTLPASTSFEFKAIIKDTNGNVEWEPGANNAYTTPASGLAEYTLYW